MPRFRGVSFLLSCGLLLVFVLNACTTSPTGSSTPTSSSTVLNVVAGENFWGSIATQLGGSHVNVTSVVSDPNADPHQYQSNTDIARAFAQANYVILNGAGYDSWGQKLLDANPVDGRKVFTVANLLGKHEGDNPHFWYNPTYVEQVSDQITRDYQALDPAASAYFTHQRAAFETALSAYHNRIAEIKAKFTGKKVGATESIFVYMANALGLNLISPPEFMNAVAEGNDPPASSVVTFQQQLRQKQISVLVYNVQTVTNINTMMKQLASQQNIPIVGISETIQPATASFQDWQTAQLQTLQNALNASAPGQ
ncbi:MAG TPA: zinc ABC transporter substrate-binding protein [Ktedonobacteraceae bacterium]|nr:zinc ABC transporter substrate-binding protein [Ktedonobacteraceae bacterium]